MEVNGLYGRVININKKITKRILIISDNIAKNKKEWIPKYYWPEGDEYRWADPKIGQGHYFAAKNLDEATKKAIKDAKLRGMIGREITIQKFRPKKGKIRTIYLGDDKT